jgi:hypothetical protein
MRYDDCDNVLNYGSCNADSFWSVVRGNLPIKARSRGRTVIGCLICMATVSDLRYGVGQVGYSGACRYNSVDGGWMQVAA